MAITGELRMQLANSKPELCFHGPSSEKQLNSAFQISASVRSKPGRLYKLAYVEATNVP